MSAFNSSQLTFSAPGPGCWEVDSTHIPRPFTVFVREAWMKAFPKGFSESTARYGSLLDHLKPAEVNGFIYQQPVAFGAPPGAKMPTVWGRPLVVAHSRGRDRE